MVGFPPKMSPRPEVEDGPDDEEEGTTALITKNAAITATMIRTTLNPGLSCAIFFKISSNLLNRCRTSSLLSEVTSSINIDDTNPIPNMPKTRTIPDKKNLDKYPII